MQSEFTKFAKKLTDKNKKMAKKALAKNVKIIKAKVAKETGLCPKKPKCKCVKKKK